MDDVAPFLDRYGLGFMFVIVMLESAGLPLPGETTLIAASVLAARGHFDIAWVIVVAASAAILGDNLGYWAGRKGGRALVARWPWLHRRMERLLPRAEALFARHGAKTVFFGRFIAILRIAAAFLAGVAEMPWKTFLFWNAAGGITWALAVGLTTYWLGEEVVSVFHDLGRWGGLAALVVLAVAAFLLHRWKRRRFEDGPR